VLVSVSLCSCVSACLCVVCVLYVVCVVCMQPTLKTMKVAGQWAGGGFLVVVRTHFVGQPPAEVKKQLLVLCS
jgi:hypothetical protein